MADKLIVENFGPIIKRTKLNIKKTTVFIGPQGSGKSTLAKLVAINNDIIGLETSKNLFSNFGMSSFFSSKSVVTYVRDNYYSVRWNHFNPTLEILKSSLKSEVTLEVDDEQKMNPKDKLRYGAEAFRKLVEKVFLPFESISNKPIYIPTERFLVSSISNSILGLINSNVNLPKSITEFGALFEMARTKILSLDIPYLKIRYAFENNSDKVYFDKKSSVKLNESASGHQAVIPLKLVVENNYQNELQNFIIEEPELNLYPITQKHLVQYLVEKCTFNKNQLLMTTHSPYVLSSLNLLIFAYQTAQKHPDQIEAIKAIVPQESWINPDEFAAYFVDKGTARSIISPKTGMIAENELDGVSDLIGDEFDALKRIYISKNYATVN